MAFRWRSYRRRKAVWSPFPAFSSNSSSVILSGNQALNPVGLAPTFITVKQLKDTLFRQLFAPTAFRGLSNTTARPDYTTLTFPRGRQIFPARRPENRTLGCNKGTNG